MSMKSFANGHVHKYVQDKISGGEHTCMHDLSVYNQHYLRTLLAAVETAIVGMRRSGRKPQLQKYLALTGLQTEIYTILFMKDE